MTSFKAWKKKVSHSVVKEAKEFVHKIDLDL